MKQGDVYWYSFRAPNKRRPVVILTRSSVIAFLTGITVVPITTTIRGIASEVLLTAVAVWASSSLTMATSQPEMDQEVMRQMFNEAGAAGKAMTFGEAVRRAKLATVDSDIRRSWVLFGDPLTKLR